MLTEDEIKQNQFNKIFFTIKIVAILFCISPTYQYFFQDNTSAIFATINVGGLIVSLGIMLVITFMWLIVDYNRKKITILTFIEISLMFIICTLSIVFSGMHESYYKFMYIFMVVSYTIEFGAKIGFAISASAGIVLFSIDMIIFSSSGVNQYFQSDVALCAMFLVVAWILGVYVRTEREHIERLKNVVKIDGLTQIFNHRYFHDEFKRQCDVCRAEKTPISLLMIDIDYFKTYNDLFGHQKGDEVLRQIAKLFVDISPAGCTVYRYGGEEFTIILPNIDQSGAMIIGENIRNAVYTRSFDGEDLLPNGSLTISIGIAELKGNDDSYTEVISRADSALYRAKYFRKNRVEIYHSLIDQFPSFNEKSDEALNTVKSFITIINSRDMYTYKHTERVVYYSELFANHMQLSEEDHKKLVHSAYLHDLGKINVSKQTLISSSKLTDAEWEEMKRHPKDGADIIRQMNALDDVAEIVEQHHEKYDGTGYPNGLKGNEICYLARMLTLADSFDAMTAKRPYQDQRSYENAYAELRKCMGTQFDPELTEEFIKALDEGAK